MIHPDRRKPVLPGTYKTTIGGQTVSYTIKRSPRAKYARLEVRAGTGLTVVIPDSYDINDISNLLRKKGRWILDKLAKYVTGYPTEGKEPKRGDSIPYLGRNLKVITRYNSGMPAGVKLEKNRLLIDLDSRNRRLNLVLEWWYRQQAEKLIKKKADELCSRLGVTYGRLTVRGARTRWGSCSQKGNLNFNWKIMMVPESVIDYIIIHELAHLKEMSHSKKFWQLVGQHCPDWRKHRRWLKAHEAELSAKLPG